MNDFNFIEIGYRIGMFFVPFLFALCFHEFSHGLVAKFFGDNTAERAGRLTLNPFAHADMMGTWILPLIAIIFPSPFMFGWAKPVPVESRNLKNPRTDLFWIALAGPLSNVFLALVSTILIAIAIVNQREGNVSDAFVNLLHNFIMVNLFLAVFNLIPVYPLDGGKVIERFLPLRWNMWMTQHQAHISMGLFVGIFLFGGLLAFPAFWAGEHLIEVAQMLAVRFGS
jgi:Zn-dependent protease